MNTKNYSAAKFNNLKSRVKAEIQRRNLEGSVESFGGSNYDYNDIPSAKTGIKLEHVNKLIEPINAINNELPNKKIGDMYLDPDIIDAKLTILESKDLNSSDTGCVASCTGLCSTTCSGTCGGDCTGTCSNTCTGDCTSTCTGTCEGECNTTCTGSCSSGCTGGCSGGCSSGCKSCSNGCSIGCSGGCEAGCSISAKGN